MPLILLYHIMSKNDGLWCFIMGNKSGSGLQEFKSKLKICTPASGMFEGRIAKIQTDLKHKNFS